MPEKIIIRQDINSKIGFWIVDTLQPEFEEYHQVQRLNELTPYGMMLASLATSTARVILSFAKNNQIALEEIELRIAYDRNFKQDCDESEIISRYNELIVEKIIFYGNLSNETRKKLFQIAYQCPVQNIYTAGIAISTKLVPQAQIETIRIKNKN
jgi:uncharacterized OsmC-like protein